MRIALRGWDGELVDSQDLLERERTRYVLREGVPVLLLALMRMLLTHPVRLMQALALTYRMSRGSTLPLFLHLAYLAEACRILPWLRKAEIPHVHAHFATNSAEVAMLIHELGGPQWSFTVHGHEAFENWRSLHLDEKIRRAKFVVTVCSFGRGHTFRCVEPQQWPKVHVVHCGLEPSFYAMVENLGPAERRFVCVGRLCGEKAQLLLVAAAARLAAQGVDFELVLAGDGEQRADVEAMIARYKLQTKVRVTGWISSEQVRDEILAARALVLPSITEGLPVVIMEAMSLKRPVISTFVCGIPELVQSGEHGWLVPAGDVEALAHAMQACLDTPAEILTRMGEAAYKRVLERHSIDTEAAKLAKLFRIAVEEESEIN